MSNTRDLRSSFDEAETNEALTKFSYQYNSVGKVTRQLLPLKLKEN